MYVVVSYLAYLAISFTATVWVGRTLYRNGRIFLVDAFHGNAELADSVNHLLVVGFYLVNAGYVALALRTSETVTEARGAIELVCGKTGVVLLVLGMMHFSNVYVLDRFRRRGGEHREPRAGKEDTGWGAEGAPLGRLLK
jgi:hypothetical protein